ncbi:MAG: hypothetical protein KatS3mg003_0792 [Candidatus Nitrosocaldaceae archaeon]|nr:MAG: hypothetical protein KatS3mg003_0792 [Candidatus Nitrosocaldaceae archaeon]
MRSYIANKKVLKKKCNYEILTVKEVADKCYKVRNAKKNTEYLVLSNYQACDCIAFEKYNNCKHLEAVKQYEMDKELLDKGEHTEELIMLE